MSWTITKDHGADYPAESAVGHMEDHSRIPMVAAVIGLESEQLPGDPLPLVAFRLKDDDGEVYYEGTLHDDDECLNQEAALSWGAGDSGCTTVEVLRDGEWKQEIA